ncbi:glycosyltransferase [Croceicoccus sp. Ery5]|jgi:glycosyltransferase involved in cell wall biosynthesis|uniref:glycosyltransferase n=1 Tax=Croceicoccus sp. Ery5 TaxID=1703340 RepID=UPI001E5E0B0D|nr:glycosyltransferase [Croceicoccus sp. Ery5]
MVSIAVVGLRGMGNIVGGIETHCRNLYPSLASKRPDWTIRVYERADYHQPSAAYAQNLLVKSLWAPRMKAAEAFFHTLFSLLHARYSFRPNIVHIHSIGPGIWTPLVRLLGLKVIVTIHARDYDRPKWNWIIASCLKIGEYLSCRFAHRVVCVSQASFDDITARYPRFADRIYTIIHGVEAQPFLDDGERSDILAELGIEPGRYILAVGRIDKTKRFQDLVDARQTLGHDALPLVIVGNTVGDTARASGIGDLQKNGVILAGARYGQALGHLYRNAALFMHPSQMEGFALVVLEGLSAGVPMALSDLPQHREFGLPDQCYFPVGDIAKIARIMTQPDYEEFRPHLDEAWLSRFNLGGMIDNYAALFEELDAMS